MTFQERKKDFQDKMDLGLRIIFDEVGKEKGTIITEMFSSDVISLMYSKRLGEIQNNKPIKTFSQITESYDRMRKIDSRGDLFVFNDRFNKNLKKLDMLNFELVKVGRRFVIKLK